MTDSTENVHMSDLLKFFIKYRDELVGKAIIQGVDVRQSFSEYNLLSDKLKAIGAMVRGGTRST